MRESNDKYFHFDEFKLFYSTTERVTDRRISANKWNYSICTATIAAIGMIAKWSITSKCFIVPSLLIEIFLSIMAILYCLYWIAQIKDYKQLNHAKFEVLEKMSKKLVFGEDCKANVVSHRPFKKEWMQLEKSRATSKSVMSNLTVLKSTRMEYVIPISFIIIFSLILFAISGFSYHYRDKFDSTFFNFEDCTKTKNI